MPTLLLFSAYFRWLRKLEALFSTINLKRQLSFIQFSELDRQSVTCRTTPPFFFFFSKNKMMHLNCMIALEWDDVPEYPKIPNTAFKRLCMFILAVLFLQKHWNQMSEDLPNQSIWSKRESVTPPVLISAAIGDNTSFTTWKVLN